MPIREIKRYSIRTPQGQAVLYERVDVTRVIDYQDDEGRPRQDYEGEWLGYVVKGDLPVKLSGDGIDMVVSPTAGGRRVNLPQSRTTRPRLGWQT